jgi:TPR repeat protein
MVGARQRRRRDCGGGRNGWRAGNMTRIRQALAAGLLMLCLSQSALAQSSARKTVPRAPAAAAAQPVRPPDLAYGAFQRGYFLTAFSLATDRVTNATDPTAMTLLGELYASGLGVPQDDQRAAEWYRLAAARGDSNAMFALAIFAIKGRAGPRDRQATTQWLAAAAKLGHPIAAYDLALLYIEGQMFPQDLNRAAELLRMAAQSGSADAQYALGTFYKTGRGVPQDTHQAVQLWGQAARADNIDAQVEYAIALYNGDGIEPNQVAATALFRKAAMHGSAIAQDRLARILVSGRGAPVNLAEAAKWHLISRAGGETDLELDDVVNKLDAQTRATAEKTAKPWLDEIAAARQAQAEAQVQPQDGGLRSR